MKATLSPTPRPIRKANRRTLSDHVRSTHTDGRRRGAEIKIAADDADADADRPIESVHPSIRFRFIFFIDLFSFFRRGFVHRPFRRPFFLFLWKWWKPTPFPFPHLTAVTASSFSHQKRFAKTPLPQTAIVS